MARKAAHHKVGKKRTSRKSHKGTHIVPEGMLGKTLHKKVDRKRTARRK